MRTFRLSILILAASLLAGCSAETILEDTPAISAPRDCSEPMRLFKDFLVRAKAISWNSLRGKDQVSTLTIDLVFENTLNWPLALSNSGNGIVYSVVYSLQNENGQVRMPMATGGVASDGGAGPRSEVKRLDRQEKSAMNVHTGIKQNDSVEGKLVFEAPRANYLLTIERKFAGQPAPGNRADHVSVCKISPSNFSSGAGKALGVQGVY